LFDLNHFKQVNDIYGHHVGDQLLKEFGDIARNQTREERDFTFRFGGDEFLILLTECNEEGAVKIAKRINEGFKEQTDNSLSYGAVSLPIHTELNVYKYTKIYTATEVVSDWASKQSIEIAMKSLYQSDKINQVFKGITYSLNKESNKI